MEGGGWVRSEFCSVGVVAAWALCCERGATMANPTRKALTRHRHRLCIPTLTLACSPAHFTFILETLTPFSALTALTSLASPTRTDHCRGAGRHQRRR